MNRRFSFTAVGIYVLAMLVFMVLAAPFADQSGARTIFRVYVYDGAGLFTAAQERELEKYLAQQGEKAGVGIYVLTSQNFGNGTSGKYSEDFYDAGYEQKTIEKKAVILHIDIRERYVNIQAYGKARFRIGDAVGDKILDAIYDNLKADEYYEACFGYADKVRAYMGKAPFYLSTWFHLLIALIVGGIAVAIMAATSSAGMTSASIYEDKANMGIRARRDDYIRTSVTRRKKPESSSSGGGKSSHRSSGGHSHSSAGRHF